MSFICHCQSATIFVHIKVLCSGNSQAHFVAKYNTLNNFNRPIFASKRKNKLILYGITLFYLLDSIHLKVSLEFE